MLRGHACLQMASAGHPRLQGCLAALREAAETSGEIAEVWRGVRVVGYGCGGGAGERRLGLGLVRSDTIIDFGKRDLRE